MSKFPGLTASIVLFALSAQAAAQVFASGEVDRLYPSSTNLISFKLKGDTCIPNENYYTFSLDAPAGKAWYAMLLTAANTGRPVTVRVTQCAASNVQADYIYQQF